ncbi:MAG TPA: hypothetical protein VKU87_09060 [Thermomicrobiaceae bacterium]|nr:hypothetical protein [Thermomicrobiaceae bacterium]
MHLPTYLTLLDSSERSLAHSYRLVSTGHADEPDVHYACAGFARCCAGHAEALTAPLHRYDDRRQPEPERLYPERLAATRDGAIGLLRDLQDLYQLANLVEITWTLIGQAAYGARDRALIDLVARCRPEIDAQLAWLRMRMQAAAPQTLLVAP